MTFRRQSWLVALAVVPGLLLAAGCSSSSPSLDSMAITPSPVRLALGGSSQLALTGTFSDGTRSPVTGATWSASPATVVAVNSSGVVTAMTSGTATVTAAFGGLSASVTVTVASGPVVLQSISIVPPAVPLRPGATAQLTVLGAYSDGSSLNVTTGSTFSGTSSAVATVSSGGLVTAVANGTATVTATHTASGLVATATVTVSTSDPTLASIAVTPSPLSLVVPATGQLTVTGTYSDRSTKNLTSDCTFVSANNGAATVSATGLVTAVGTGTAVVTATHTASGLVGSATVNASLVPPTLTSITVEPSAPTVAIGATQQLTVTGHYSDTTTVTLTTGLTYASSATAFATVSASGLVTGVATGSATITVTHTASNLTATSTVTVPAPVTLTSITVAPTAPTIGVGATQQLTVTGHYSDTTTATLASGLTYASSATGVATVSASGLVTGVATGSATITVTHTATSLIATSAVTVGLSSGGAVFVNGAYDTGVTFAPYGGSTNDITVDATVQRNGHATLKVVVPAAGYTGGTFTASSPRDLSGFNVLTYWAMASTANSINNTGIGNDANGGGSPYRADSNVVPLTATWTKYYIPIPVPAKITSNAALFDFAEGAKNYTIWLSDIQYENLGAGVVDAPTAATVGWAAIPVAVGSTFQIDPAPNTVTFTNPASLPAHQVFNVGFGYYDLVSSAPAVATVSPSGLVTGVSGGTASISATLGALAVPGVGPVTVTAPLAVPATLATTPVLTAGNYIMMFNSSGTYTNHAVDTWNAVWSPQILSNYVISGKTVMKYTGLDYVGIEFFNPGPAIDATGFTHFHVDIWTPNGAKFSIQLVNNVGATQTLGQVNLDGTTTPAVTTGTWVGLDIPLTSFTSAGLGGVNALGQMLFLNQGAGSVPGAVFYVDNVYFWK